MSDYSLNESASRFRLAAKGAGYSWGYSDEICRAGYWLCSRSLPAATPIAKLLKHIQATNDLNQCMPELHQLTKNSDYNIESRGDWLCPIMLGATISDGVVLTSASEKITAKNIKCPLLILPFMADLAIRLNSVVCISLDAYIIRVSATHLRISSDDVLALNESASIEIALQDENKFEFSDDDTPCPSDRVNIDPDTWKLLEAFAHQTYAPATESSRLLGAGAGVQDND